MSIPTPRPFGFAKGEPVHAFTLVNGGLEAVVSSLGATLVSLKAPDRKGKLDDIVLGFDSAEEYLSPDNPYAGATAGRCANRIARGSFKLDGKTFKLGINNGPNHLHGGPDGWSHRVWTAHPLQTSDGNPAVRFELVSPDGDGGYPGRVECTVTYTLTTHADLVVDMQAKTDAGTVVNLAHHTYWNLAGHGSGDILGQNLKIHATMRTPTDDTLIPSGGPVAVAGTAYDFREAKPIGCDLSRIESPEKVRGGYDDNFLVDGPEDSFRPVAVAEDPVSGRRLELSSNQPGVQLYTGSWIKDGLRGKGGATYHPFQGFALETQHVPDAINQSDKFTAPVLHPGRTYRHVMVHHFSCC